MPIGHPLVRASFGPLTKLLPTLTLVLLAGLSLAVPGVAQAQDVLYAADAQYNNVLIIDQDSGEMTLLGRVFANGDGELTGGRGFGLPWSDAWNLAAWPTGLVSPTVEEGQLFAIESVSGSNNLGAISRRTGAVTDLGGTPFEADGLAVSPAGELIVADNVDGHLSSLNPDNTNVDRDRFSDGPGFDGDCTGLEFVPTGQSVTVGAVPAAAGELIGSFIRAGQSHVGIIDFNDFDGDDDFNETISNVQLDLSGCAGGTLRVQAIAIDPADGASTWSPAPPSSPGSARWTRPTAAPRWSPSSSFGPTIRRTPSSPRSTSTSSRA